MEVRCPHYHTPVDLASDSPLSDIACPSCGSSFSLLGGDETVAYEGATKTIGHFELIEQIGRYKLLQQIGEGGFGVVYMAEQQRPVQRKVALKIIKPGMDTKSVVVD